MLHWYLLGKPAQLWGWNILTGAGDIYIYSVRESLYRVSGWAIASYSLMKSAHIWLVGVAFLSIPCIVAFRHWRKPVILIIALSFLYLTAVYVVTQAEPRYSIPVRPQMYLLAVFFICQVHAILKDRRGNSTRADEN